MLPLITFLIAAVPTAPASGFLGWGAADLPLLLCLPVLLLLSGFFSGSETALFGMNESQRMGLRQDHPVTARMVDALLDDQRMLLITVLLGNMTVNVLYFVINSVLMMRSSLGVAGQGLLATVFLLVIVLTGEVGPKIVANATRLRFVALTSPLLLTFHRLIGPLRVPIEQLIVTPLSRLTAPRTTPDQLHDEELQALLQISGEQGVIDPEIQRVLRDVLDMRRRTVRDVMTPRVRMVTVPATATRSVVEAALRTSRLTRLPVHGRDLDEIVGVLHVGRYLLAAEAPPVTDPSVTTEPRYVPGLARLDQLLDHFSRSHTRSAIVVDEYGGTEGVVSVEDVVEEIVGDIVAADEEVAASPRLIGIGRWHVGGDVRLIDLAAAFEIDPNATSATTLGGLITQELGRAPHPGDVVELEGVTIEVEAVARNRVLGAVVTLREALGGDGPGREQAP